MMVSTGRLALVFVLLASAAFAQSSGSANSGTIVGQVATGNLSSSDVLVVLNGKFAFRSTPADAKGAFVFTGLPFGSYEVRVVAPTFCPATTTTTVKSGGPAPVFLDLKQPLANGSCFDDTSAAGKEATGILAPAFDILPQTLKKILARSPIQGKTGAALYDSLGDKQKATLLNLTAKMLRTALHGKPIIGYMTRVTELSDYYGSFELDPATLALLKTDPHFHSVSPAMRKVPKTYAICKDPVSYKTDDAIAILHVTACSSGNSLDAHMDEDSAKEAFSIFNGWSPSANPYVIHDLLERQNIPTGYRLKVNAGGLDGKAVPKRSR